MTRPAFSQLYRSGDHDFYIVQKRRPTDFEAPKLQKKSVGQLTLRLQNCQKVRSGEADEESAAGESPTSKLGRVEKI